jgi:hypothetical protein
VYSEHGIQANTVQVFRRIFNLSLKFFPQHDQRGCGMSMFADREKALENEFFNRQVQGNRQQVAAIRRFANLLGRAMGYNDEAAENYSDTLAGLYAERSRPADVLDRVLCDLANLGIPEPRAVLREKLAQAQQDAAQGG